MKWQWNMEFHPKICSCLAACLDSFPRRVEDFTETECSVPEKLNSPRATYNKNSDNELLQGPELLKITISQAITPSARTFQVPVVRFFETRILPTLPASDGNFVSQYKTA
nr:small integral membrane protein 11A isoform X1 [Zootoca vivipara]